MNTKYDPQAYDSKVAAIHTLRINVKSLAQEARYIRHEEQRCGPAYREQLHNHRTVKVRQESRVAQLALAYVRGKPRESVDNSITWHTICVTRERMIREVEAKLKKHGIYPRGNAIQEWLCPRRMPAKPASIPAIP